MPAHRRSWAGATSFTNGIVSITPTTLAALSGTDQVSNILTSSRQIPFHSLSFHPFLQTRLLLLPNSLTSPISNARGLSVALSTEMSQIRRSRKSSKKQKERESGKQSLVVVKHQQVRSICASSMTQNLTAFSMSAQDQVSDLAICFHRSNKISKFYFL